MNRVHLTIKGQKYVATFVEATVGFGPCWRVVRQEKYTDNLRGGYIVKVDEGGQPIECSCLDCYFGSDDESIRHCKHMKALNGLRLSKDREFQEELGRYGLGLPSLDKFVAMKVGEVWTVNGHKVERFASAWKIDERFVFSWNGIKEALAERDPCLPLQSANTTTFEEI